MDKKTFAFIPARAGSLGIKNKNLQKVSGISLVKRSYDHAISSEIFGKIIISTDSFEIISEITSTFLYAEFKQFSENSLVEISSNTFLHKRRIDQAESLSPIREVIFDLANNLEFDQLIWEFGTDTNPDWVHVSYESNGRQRKQILRAVKKNGATSYLPYK
jgi:hypothetical protein